MGRARCRLIVLWVLYFARVVLSMVVGMVWFWVIRIPAWLVLSIGVFWVLVVVLRNWVVLLLMSVRHMILFNLRFYDLLTLMDIMDLLVDFFVNLLRNFSLYFLLMVHLLDSVWVVVRVVLMVGVVLVLWMTHEFGLGVWEVLMMAIMMMMMFLLVNEFWDFLVFFGFSVWGLHVVFILMVISWMVYLLKAWVVELFWDMSRDFTMDVWDMGVVVVGFWVLVLGRNVFPEAFVRVVAGVGLVTWVAILVVMVSLTISPWPVGAILMNPWGVGFVTITVLVWAWIPRFHWVFMVA